MKSKRTTRRRRSRKSIEHYRRKRVADIKHMLRCCSHGRLPETHCDYLQGILSQPYLPPPEEIAKRVGLTYAQREANRLWSIPPIDMTKKELAALRRRKDRERKMKSRRKAGAVLRQAYLAKFQKPWIAAGIPRSTWYRRQAKIETRPSVQQKCRNETRPSEVQGRSEAGPSAHIYTTTAEQRVSVRQSAPPIPQRRSLQNCPVSSQSVH